MTAADYEKALIVQATFRLAKSDDVNELLAIACVIRNLVVPRLGQVPEYPSYTAAIEEMLNAYELRPFPRHDNPALVDPDDGLLVKVDGVYDNSMPDFTSSRSHPGGARFFCSARRPAAWFQSSILDRPDVHALIGSFGSQQFYA